jgi:drug/metabolite transporter (DMT)-like permease
MVLLFATIFIMGKICLQFVSPIFLTGVRMLLAGSLILIYQYLYNRQSLTVEKKDIKPLFMLTFFNVYLTNVLEFWGLQYLVSAKACFLYSLSPFVAALFSYFMFNEMMTYKKWAALILGFLGFFPILLNESATERLVGGLWFFSWPELALLGAAIATVYGWISMRQLVVSGYNPITANGISMFVAGIICFPTSLIFERWDPVPVVAWWPFIAWLIPMTLVSNIICYNLYGFLLKKYSATLMSFVGFSSPFFTALYGWIVLKETVSLSFFISALIVFSALYLFYQEELKQGYINKDVPFS